MFRTRIYESVELSQQNTSKSRKCRKVPTRSKEDIKADTVALQENPSYVTKNEFS